MKKISCVPCDIHCQYKYRGYDFYVKSYKDLYEIYISNSEYAIISHCVSFYKQELPLYLDEDYFDSCIRFYKSEYEY